MARPVDRLRQGIVEFARGDKATPAFDVLARGGDTLNEIPVEHIHPDPNQPRKNLGDLSELKASIERVGIIQPILVTVVGEDSFRLVAGERRYTAAKELGFSKVPAIVRTIEEQKLLEVQIIENVQRKDLNPIEEAESYQRLMDEFGLTQEQVALRVGKSKSTINEIVRILKLSGPLLQEVRTSELASKSVLLEIAKQPTEDKQRGLWEQAKRGELTVKKARATKKPQERKGGKSVTSLTPGPKVKGLQFRYPIQTDLAEVTLTFAQPHATFDEIIAALEQALEGERARRR